MISTVKPAIAETIAIYVASILAVLLAFPPDASAVEVGCFCTFVFVSTMFAIGVGLTLLAKHLLSGKIWKLSLRRTILITFLEVIMLFAVVFLVQTKFYIRVLVYLPLAFLLNYSLTTRSGQENQTSQKRALMAVISCCVLPAAVQLMAWLATVLSEMITFKEVRI